MFADHEGDRVNIAEYLLYRRTQARLRALQSELGE
ncbi:hypothetical protein JOD62_000878 [Microbacterium keratanolyticum]|nr:hypothetical protein [Microbacterium keratanolyticum]